VRVLIRIGEAEDGVIESTLRGSVFSLTSTVDEVRDSETMNRSLPSVVISDLPSDSLSYLRRALGSNA
jgi:hypothetical protein